MRSRSLAGWLLGCAAVALAVPPAAAAWEPVRPIELVVPAGTGGAVDQMARLIAGIAEKHKLSPMPFVVVNRSGGAGAEGLLHVKGKRGEPHTLVLASANLFTTPLATGVPFQWRDLTPVAGFGIEQFALWVNAESPFRTAGDYLDAARARPGALKMGGREAPRRTRS